MKLHPTKTIGKHPLWCGPSALSIMTGRTVNYCAKLIADQRNRHGWYRGRGSSKQVRGVSNLAMKMALQKMGYRMVNIGVPLRCHKHQVMSVNPEPFVKPTLFQYMSERGGPDWKKTVLIECGNHYVVASHDTVADNTQPLGCHYSDHHAKRKRVANIWLVSTMRVS